MLKALLPSWATKIIPLIPGLPALAFAYYLPEGVRLLFASVLSILLFTTLAVVHLTKDQLSRWCIRRTVKWLGIVTAGAIACHVLFFVAHSSLIQSYRFPPASARETVVLLPLRFHVSPLSVGYPFLDCRRSLTRDCESPVPREAETAKELTDLLNRWGNFDIQLPTGGAMLTSVILLLAFYVLATIQLVWLFGFAFARGITLRVLLAEFGEAHSQPGDDPAADSPAAVPEVPSQVGSETAGGGAAPA
jgi:hypothetical protein